MIRYTTRQYRHKVYVKKFLPNKAKNCLPYNIKISLPYDVKNCLPYNVKKTLPNDVKICLTFTDERFMSRITSIGLTPGCSIRVIRNDKNRPMLIYSRLARKTESLCGNK